MRSQIQSLKNLPLDRVKKGGEAFLTEPVDPEFGSGIQIKSLKKTTSLDDLDDLYDEFNKELQIEVPEVLPWFYLNQGLFNFFQNLNFTSPSVGIR